MFGGKRLTKLRFLSRTNRSLIQVRYWFVGDRLELTVDTYMLKLILIYPAKLNPPVMESMKELMNYQQFIRCRRKPKYAELCAQFI